MAQKELPKMILNRTGKVYVIPSDGKLLYKYQPFYNLKIDKRLMYPIDNGDKVDFKLDYDNRF